MVAIRLSAIHTDDGGTPRDLHWRRDEQRQEVVFIREVVGHPAAPFQFWTRVLGLEACARRWGTCAGCGWPAQLIIDPETPGCEWCDRCSTW